MGNWRKRLAEMAADPRPNNYRYSDVVPILERLGFTLAGRPGGSHRRWRMVLPDTADPSRTRTVFVALVDNGNGPMKAVYVKELLRTLRANDLLPER